MVVVVIAVGTKFYGDVEMRGEEKAGWKELARNI